MAKGFLFLFIKLVYIFLCLFINMFTSGNNMIKVKAKQNQTELVTILSLPKLILATHFVQP